ncbi:MAG: hypothetical protein HY000_11310 [Planctomycetes bacterium]|nr:hypothetical protein [Planctomycetota bacterium]
MPIRSSARATVTVQVLVQLGAAYQNLPGKAMAGYQADRDALQTDVTAIQSLLDQIRVLLEAIDQKCQPLDEKNKAILRALQRLLLTDADWALLAQITGPTEQGPSPAPTPRP